jgi:hypothetical protein
VEKGKASHSNGYPFGLMVKSNCEKNSQINLGIDKNSIKIVMPEIAEKSHLIVIVFDIKIILYLLVVFACFAYVKI